MAPAARVTAAVAVVAAGAAAAEALAAAAAAAVNDPYTYFQGFLAAGDDIMNGTYTVAAAEAACDAVPACLGFTFANSTTRNAAAAAADPSFLVYFKSAVAATPDAGWSSYLRVVPRIFSATFTDHVVIQHDAPCLTGYGPAPGAAVAVTSSSDGARVAGAVGPDLTWRVCLAPQAPGGPWTVNATVAGLGSGALADVLFGDVWVASGQSNMAFTVKQAFNASAECAAAAAWPALRVMTVAQTSSPTPVPDFGPGGVRQAWAPSSPEAVCGGGDFDYFTAVGWFFGRELAAARGIPIGVIATTVPGTNIELWSSPDALAACNSTTTAEEEEEEGGGSGGAAVAVDPAPSVRRPSGAGATSARRPGGAGTTAQWASPVGDGDSGLWNAMVVPLLNLSVRGAVWYQVRPRPQPQERTHE
jgi:hypothetical protein